MSNKLHKSEWEVRPVSISTARRLVESLHYAHHASNTATYLHGLFKKGAFWERDCCGVVWWLPPTKSAALATYPENWQGVLSLSRLVIVPDVPTNACSFLLARSRRMIDREKWPCLVTYADTWRAHTGNIYRADNWTYCGLTNPEAVFMVGEKMVSRKAGPKTRTKAEMEAIGAVCLGKFAKHKFMRVN